MTISCLATSDTAIRLQGLVPLDSPYANRNHHLLWDISRSSPGDSDSIDLIMRAAIEICDTVLLSALLYSRMIGPSAGRPNLLACTLSTSEIAAGLNDRMVRDTFTQILLAREHTSLLRPLEADEIAPFLPRMLPMRPNDFILPSFDVSTTALFTSDAIDLLLAHLHGPSLLVHSRLTDAQFDALVTIRSFGTDRPYNEVLARHVTTTARLVRVTTPGLPGANPTLELPWTLQFASCIGDLATAEAFLPHLSPGLVQQLLIHNKPFEHLPYPRPELIARGCALLRSPLATYFSLAMRVDNPTRRTWYLARLLLRVPGLAAHVLDRGNDIDDDLVTITRRLLGSHAHNPAATRLLENPEAALGQVRAALAALERAT